MHAVHFWGQGSSYLSIRECLPVTKKERKGEGKKSISPWMIWPQCTIQMDSPNFNCPLSNITPISLFSLLCDSAQVAPHSHQLRVPLVWFVPVQCVWRQVPAKQHPHSHPGGGNSDLKTTSINTPFKTLLCYKTGPKPVPLSQRPSRP